MKAGFKVRQPMKNSLCITTRNYNQHNKKQTYILSSTPAKTDPLLYRPQSYRCL